jgi:SecD/SecF fusion protein
MNGRIFWKFFISACVFAWSVYYLIPLRDTPFPEYLTAQVTAMPDQFAKLMDKANQQVEQARLLDIKMKADEAAAVTAGQTYLADPKDTAFVQGHRTLFLALKSIGEADKVDYSQFFPQLAVGDIKNIPRRNDVILSYLLRSSKGRLKYGLDLQGGVSLVFSVDAKSLPPGQQGVASMEKVIEIMQKRVNGLGVNDAVVRLLGTNQIEVDIPGVSAKDNPQVIDEIGKPAKLEFRMVSRTFNPATTPASQAPLGYEVLNYESENKQTGEKIETPFYVNVRPAALGNIIKNAYPRMDASGRLAIELTLTDDGAKVFENITKQIEDENNQPAYVNLPEEDPARYGKLAIVLDGQLYSAPQVKVAIPGGHAEISGDFSQREAIELANALNNPLEHALKIDEMDEVGPSLAADARDSSIKASVLGSALVIALMLVMYTIAGVLSIITLAMHMLVIIGIQSSIGVTLTLPGVAALVLTVGLAVDANILIYERMREELAAGKSLMNALEAGYSRALASIIDSNFTTLITAGILIWLGTGPIKGFGVILAIGLLSNLLCVLVFNQALLELVISKGWVKKLRFLRLIPQTSIPFYSYRIPAIVFSLLVIAVGLGSVYYRGNTALGVDFRGGEEISATFAQVIPIGDIEKTARGVGITEVVSNYETELGTGQQELKFQTEAGQGQKLFAELVKDYPQAKLKFLGTNLIGPEVSDNLKWNALLSLVLALLGVMVYVAFRFEVGYAVGAIVATLHDVLVTVGVFVLLGGQFSAPMVAAVLMIIGYSLNDKVIIFDRVREELKLNPHLKLMQVLDLAVNRTLARTTLTSLTTFLASTALFVFAAGVVSDFALVFMIGIVTATFSSIFIANPVFFWWHKGDRRHVEAHEFLPKYEWDPSTRANR